MLSWITFMRKHLYVSVQILVKKYGCLLQSQEMGSPTATLVSTDRLPTRHSPKDDGRKIPTDGRLSAMFIAFAW